MDSRTTEPSQDSGHHRKGYVRRAERDWQTYTRKFPRSLIPKRYLSGTKPLETRATKWILPWGMRDYPGMQLGSLELFAGRVALETLRAWWKGNRRMPDWAALMLAEAIKVRLASGAALVVELEAYAAERAGRPKSGPGFRKVDPVTGQDGRPKIGRRRPKEL